MNVNGDNPKRMENFVKVAKTTDLPEGQIMQVEVGREYIVLSNIGGQFYAIGEECAHANGPLSEGILDGEQIECPWHGSRFNLKTGEALSPPATEPVPCYPVRIEGDDILIGVA